MDFRDENINELIGKTATFFCQIYIYTGKVVAVNEKSVHLRNAKVVYETGPFTDSNWKDAQSLPTDWHIARQSIESFGILK